MGAWMIGGMGTVLVALGVLVRAALRNDLL
jgi:hypothetical protein